MVDWSLAINVTITGLVLVFAVLVLLVYILELFGKVSEAIKNNSDRKAAKAREQALSAMANDNAAEDQTVAAVISSNDGLSEEVVAVISAAISTLYAGSAKKPVIKAIKKSSARRSAWANAGIADNTRSF